MGNVLWVGQNAEYSNISINHYRNLIQHRLTLTVSQRPTFQPRATNTDYKSQAQVKLAHGLLDYYMREKKLERYIKTAGEFALVYGEGFLRTDWDAQIGEEYGTTERWTLFQNSFFSNCCTDTKVNLNFKLWVLSVGEGMIVGISTVC